jgi:hypothetical protein
MALPRRGNRAYPRGYALFGTLIAYLVLSVAGVRRRGPHSALATIGLLIALGCFIEMGVAILGDGTHELTKHLFMANVLFDVGTIAVLNMVVAYGLGFPTRVGNAQW